MIKNEIEQFENTMTAPVNVEGIYLETPRLILRPLAFEDLMDIHAIYSQPEVAQMEGFLRSENLEMSQNRLKEYIEDGQTVAVVLKDNQRVIGTISLQKRPWKLYPLDISFKGRELGFDLNKDYWGRGLMPEAVKCLCDFCFKSLHYDFLTASYFRGNDKSKKAIEKCGFSCLFEDDRCLPRGDTVHILTYIRYNPQKEAEYV